MTQKEIQKIISACPENVELSAWLEQEFKRVRTITQNLRSLEQERDTAQIEAKNRLHRIDMAVKAVQQECPHYAGWFYHQDASGGNDSYFTCVTCGKER